MDNVTYNIPASLVESYRGKQKIVRTDDPFELLQKVTDLGGPDVSFIQLLSPAAGVDELFNWKQAIPLDVVMRNPAADFPLLYNFSKLLDKHPVRISIHVAPGFSKAVRLAASLNFPVKLEVTQPDRHLVDELLQNVNYYLHHGTVTQPVEFFHSLLFAFYGGEPATLWQIQEEDPAHFRYVTDHGDETYVKDLDMPDIGNDPNKAIQKFKARLLAEKRECTGCKYLDYCDGYFKWPDKAYECTGVLEIFKAIEEAAKALKQDLEKFEDTKKQRHD